MKNRTRNRHVEALKDVRKKAVKERKNPQLPEPQAEDRDKVFREASRAAKPLIAAASQGVVIADCCSSQIEFLYDRGKISTLDFKEFQHRLTDVRIELSIAQKLAARLSTDLQIQVDLKLQAEEAAQLPTCSECGMEMKPFGQVFRCDNCGSMSGNS